MGKITKEQAAFWDNSVLMFLVDCCEEDPRLEWTGISLHDNYCYYMREVLGKMRFIYSASTFYKKLEEAGFVKEMYHNDLFQVRIKFKGLAVVARQAWKKTAKGKRHDIRRLV